MIGLNQIISYLYPDIDFVSGCIIRNDGAGAYIESWTDARPQPTQQEINDAYVPCSRSIQIDYMRTVCQSAIESGFTSSALGSVHTYDSKLPQDQTNLIGARLVGIDMNYTCTDETGYKSQKPHTVAQIEQVYLAGMIHIQTNKAIFYLRKSAIESATTIEEIEAVVW